MFEVNESGGDLKTNFPFVGVVMERYSISLTRSGAMKRLDPVEKQIFFFVVSYFIRNHIIHLRYPQPFSLNRLSCQMWIQFSDLSESKLS